MTWIAGGEYDFETSDPKYFTNNGLTNTLLNPNENQTFSPDRSPISG